MAAPFTLVPPPGPKPPRRADPDDLARAMAALAQAMAAEPGAGARPRSDAPAPRWRAGPSGGGRPLAPAKPGALSGAGTPPEKRDPLARRITSIHLSRLSIERWQTILARQGDEIPPDCPAALATEGPHGPVIHATTRAAEAAGVQRGARVVDMRALVPDLRVDYADVAGDRMALQRLMLWTRRWCPWTAVDGEDGLFLDTTGSDHLWGGEAGMLRDIEEKLALLGLSADLAIAPTLGAAWALARFGLVRETCTADALTPRMAPLPVRALRLDGDTVQLLNRLGLKTVGALAEVPRLSLARRFSAVSPASNPLLRLDQMLGRQPEPLEAPDDPPRFAVETRLPEPIEDPTPHLPALASELCEGLAAAGFGARRIRLTIYRTDGEVAHAEVATAEATRDPAHIARLFDGKLDRIDPGFGFDLVTLGASVAEDLAQLQPRLDGRPDSASELARLTDRLSARFGHSAIRRARLRESHIPERRESWLAALGPRGRPAPPAREPRPLRLLDPPEEIRVIYAVPEGPPAQFVWRRLTHKVIRFAGPERVAPEWWQDRPGTRLRDYYRIENQSCQRVWIYRDGVLGDDRGAEPRWFVHGFFLSPGNRGAPAARVMFPCEGPAPRAPRDISGQKKHRRSASRGSGCRPGGLFLARSSASPPVPHRNTARSWLRKRCFFWPQISPPEAARGLPTAGSGQTCAPQALY